MTRIVIVSRSPLLADGLLAALSAVEGWRVDVAAAPDDSADVLVMPWQEGQAWPTTTAALVLMADGVPTLPRELQRRPVAVLSSSATPPQLRAAVGAVLQGLSVREAGADRGAPGIHLQPADHEPLTPREIEVYELLAKGLSNRDIAGVLGISAHTAKYHVGQILAKVGAATRAEAVSAGLRMGIIGL